MEAKWRSGRLPLMPMMLLFFIILCGKFQGCFSEVWNKRKSAPPAATKRFGSSVVLPITGNVYPLGYYYVTVNIGNPPKLYELDIDTGSDLTWVQCDAPCVRCTKPRDSLYKPKGNLVPCQHSLCAAIQAPETRHCKSPTDQCDYEVDYADTGSSSGVLVADILPLRLSNGSVIGPRLAFGCGYDQKNPGPGPAAPTAGVLGLGNGKVGLVSQMYAMGVTQNVMGHCLSGQGGGFIFIGEYLFPPSGIVWTPMTTLKEFYSSGPTELFFGGKPSGLKGLQVIFDSGSSYTYFNSEAYKTMLNLIRQDIKGKPLKDAPEDKTLPVCWKGGKPFKSIRDVSGYFKPMALSFTNAKNVQLQLPPEAYLIVTEKGNVCLGILNGTEIDLGNLNILGDISLQDKMVIYDNGKQQIGWVSTDCNRLPKS
ncbi:aspartic proteinase Asp1-like isoform X2 [Tripterygium wilfordii]|uniref:aspartic proteinase Asp1-like isoform X2 n=1 Tax=Tripterygium wilfordii TaxID=458696 RepID=UPI0018F83414|nr:aspartic proteinase Asp1-like isoform X2 [Tripterygium wilfordii]